MYQVEISRLSAQLGEQKEHAENQLKKLENSHIEKIKEY